MKQVLLVHHRVTNLQLSQHRYVLPRTSEVSSGRRTHHFPQSPCLERKYANFRSHHYMHLTNKVVKNCAYRRKPGFLSLEDPIRLRTMPFCQKNFRLSGGLHIAKCALSRHLTQLKPVPIIVNSLRIIRAFVTIT